MKFAKTSRYKAATQCPCGKSNKDGKFVPFEISGTPSNKFGYCHSCGKSFYPSDKQSIEQDNSKSENILIETKSVPLIKMSSTLENYSKNNFAIWLNDNFQESSKKALKDYRVGTTYYYKTIFWYIDKNGVIRNAKSFLYNSNSGKRIKESPIYHLYKSDDGYSTCLFGEHLLLYKSREKTITIVESEKTAVIGSIIYPNYIWLASGGANSLTIEKAQALKNRNVIYIPDCDQAGINSIPKVSRILSNVKANFTIEDSFSKEYNKGEDIVDLLFKNHKDNN